MLDYAYNKYMRKISDPIRVNPQQFWSFVNGLRNNGGLEPKVTRCDNGYRGKEMAAEFAE